MPSKNRAQHANGSLTGLTSQLEIRACEKKIPEKGWSPKSANTLPSNPWLTVEQHMYRRNTKSIAGEKWEWRKAM